MSLAIHQENFLVIRKTYPKTAYLVIKDPSSILEKTFQSILADANQNYFQHEYNIALSNYLGLRRFIFFASHPEMPVVPGGMNALDIDFSSLTSERLFEMGRRMLVNTHPGESPLQRLVMLRLRAFTGTPTGEPFRKIGLNAPVPPHEDLHGRRLTARSAQLEGNTISARNFYAAAIRIAKRDGQLRAAAELSAECGAMLATYVTADVRPTELRSAADSFSQAEVLFHRLGDEEATAVMRENLNNLSIHAKTLTQRSLPADSQRSIRRQSAPRIRPRLDQLVRADTLPTPGSPSTYLVPVGETFEAASSLIIEHAVFRAAERTVGIKVDQSVKSVPLDDTRFADAMTSDIYEPRVTADTLNKLDFHEALETNFVAYIPHLYFFVLPIATGDCYLALGQYEEALKQYQSVLNYAFLNHVLEARYLWLKIAQLTLQWADELFRRNQVAAARALYEQIITAELAIPANSPLYSPKPFDPLKATVEEVIKSLAGEAKKRINPQIASVVTNAYMQLQKIVAGLNFLGLSDDHTPIFRFKYLQAVANYMVDSAIQTERSFISFRQAAETAKLEHMQLENAAELNQALLKIEEKRLEDAALEVQYANDAVDYAHLQIEHADEAIQDWLNEGREAGTMSVMLAWAAQAHNDLQINTPGVSYHGETVFGGYRNVEDYILQVGTYRENLNWRIQMNKLAQQKENAKAEFQLSHLRKDQAIARFQIQKLAIGAATVRMEGSQEVLDYAGQRMFDEELWFKLADELRDLSRHYLDMAIYAAFLMERAYELEFERDLKRIRLDYGIGGTEGLLGGDYLKRDIASFTHDYLKNAAQTSPVRLPISLREQFPSAYAGFLKTGILPFTTDLELFDRRYPGTYQRKIKKIEVIVEGLLPSEGIHGTLLHQGISVEWGKENDEWRRKTRLHPPARMILSSYHFRRDLVVFQPSEEMLGLMENLGPQGNWRIELPMSANNLAYEALTDIKFIVYFDALHDHRLAQMLKTLYPQDSGRSLILSSRFHFPDEYFRLEAEREVTFALHPSNFAYNITDLRLAGMGVRLRAKPGQENEQEMAGQSITIVRLSDGSEVEGVTDRLGRILSDQETMVPFVVWRDQSPADAFSVRLDATTNLDTLDDVELFIDYEFSYRPDGEFSTGDSE